MPVLRDRTGGQTDTSEKALYKGPYLSLRTLKRTNRDSSILSIKAGISAEQVGNPRMKVLKQYLVKRLRDLLSETKHLIE